MLNDPLQRRANDVTNRDKSMEGPPSIAEVAASRVSIDQTRRTVAFRKVACTPWNLPRPSFGHARGGHDRAMTPVHHTGPCDRAEVLSVSISGAGES
jgi:hypothetical protein